MKIDELARYELINCLIEKFHFKDYLEIGYQQGVNYNKINIENKTAVDPSPAIQIDHGNLSVIDNIYVEKRINLYLTTSDLFFETFDYKYDLVFIDGLHTYEQVKRDFENSFKALNETGLIVLHDMNPEDVSWNGAVITGEERARSFAEGGQWNGDCYKFAIDIYNGAYDFEYFTLDMDQGCMVAFPFSKRTVIPNTLERSYRSLASDRKKILNLVSPADFVTILEVNR